MHTVYVRLFSNDENLDTSSPKRSVLTFSTSSGRGSASFNISSTNEDFKAVVMAITALPVTYFCPLISFVICSQGLNTKSNFSITTHSCGVNKLKPGLRFDKELFISSLISMNLSNI